MATIKYIPDDTIYEHHYNIIMPDGKPLCGMNSEVLNFGGAYDAEFWCRYKGIAYIPFDYPTQQ